jgi:DNA-binding transcriptional LysR family regulator
MTDQTLPEQNRPGPLRLGFVAGVMPDKWVRRWRERERRAIELVPVDETEQLVALREGRIDLCFVRAQARTEDCHVIPLYDEEQVVVVAIDHLVSVTESVTLGDLAEEQLLLDPEALPGWSEASTVTRLDWPAMTVSAAIELAATGAGVVVVPQSVARLHHRKDLTYRPVSDLHTVPIGLAWRVEATDPGIETFIGIVRGRTERSSRG